jgi:hypothetical protein
MAAARFYFSASETLREENWIMFTGTSREKCKRAVIRRQEIWDPHSQSENFLRKH